VLIAEDETLIRLDLRALLERAGFEVCAEAGDGIEAVELARAHEPRLAILDVRMPRLDGIEAARRILEERQLPILLLTAYDEEELVRRAADAGVYGYLVKPFGERDLLPAIRTAAARHEDLAALRTEAASLADALAARKSIERAKGLLMAVEGITEEEAFVRLRTEAQASRRPLKAVADAEIERLAGAAPTRQRPVAAAPAGAGEVLELVRSGKAATRGDLVWLTGLSRSTVSVRLDALLAAGYLVPGGQQPSSGGRPPSTFAFNRDGGVVLVAELGRDSSRAALADFAGGLLAERRGPVGLVHGHDAVDAWLEEQLGELLAAVRRPRDDLRGIGLGLPPAAEARRLGAGRGVPVAADGCVNLRALAEHRTQWPDVAHLLYVAAGETVECALVVDGTVHRGTDGAAGLLDGAWEPGSTGRTAGRELGELLATAVDLFNPALLVLAGAGEGPPEQLLAGVRELVYRRSAPRATRELRIVPAALDGNAALAGAALLVTDRLLAPAAVDRRLER
jgi:AmiR/NasT family two-component response regulator/predicted NBD/HSP70 family sugar kinase